MSCVPLDLFGKYRLGERIARGGMAEIYHAHVIGAGGFAREIVVKRILPDLVEDEEFREMFQDEANLASRLDHPNIVQIFDFDHVDDSFYIAMEYVRGADFSKLIRSAAERRDRVPKDVVVLVLSDILLGLRHAHELKDDEGHPLNLVHRDISPANVLLSYNGAVKLADFGIAKAATSLVHTSAGVLKGKYPYMSPEQAAGKPIDRRSDLFSVGIVMYQALVGRRPFRGKDTAELLDAVMNGRYAPPRSLVPSLPRSLAHIIDRALSVDADERYQNADEFLQGLRGALDEAPPREILEKCLRKYVPEKPRTLSVNRPRMEVAPTLKAPSVRSSADVDSLGETAVDVSASEVTQPSLLVGSVRKPRKTWLIAAIIVVLVAIVAGSGLVVSGVLPGGGDQGGGAETPSTDSSTQTFTVLARRSTDQENALRQNGLDSALERRGLKLRLLRFNQYDELFERLNNTQIDLASVPLAVAKTLAQRNLIVPVEQVAGERLTAVQSRFAPAALEVAAVDTALGSDLTFVPEYLEVHVLAYRVSKVEFARRRWTEFRAEIDAALGAINGRGLPEGYELETEPQQWDDFDVFVLGWTWAHADHEQTRPAPRIALRSSNYWPSVEGIIERALRHGQTQPTWVQGQPLLDVMTWLALHRQHGLQRPEVWAEVPAQRANGTSVTSMFGRGEVYMARVNQFRCSELRERLGQFQPGFELDDIAFAPLPAGVSPTLNEAGQPERAIGNDGLVNAWLWAIPRSARNSSTSLDIALDLVSADNQTFFATHNCWIPTNTAVDTSETGGIEPYCRRAIAPGLDRLSRTLRVAYPPDGERLNLTVNQFERLWTDLFFHRGYRTPDGEGVSVDQISQLVGRYAPGG